LLHINPEPDSTPIMPSKTMTVSGKHSRSDHSGTRLGHAGICLDTVNSLSSLEPISDVVQVLGAYTVNVHLKDFTIRRVNHQMGFVVEGCPAGDGRLDIPWLLKEIRADGRAANAVLELWTPPAATIEATVERENSWATASVATLRKFIKD